MGCFFLRFKLALLFWGQYIGFQSGLCQLCELSFLVNFSLFVFGAWKLFFAKLRCFIFPAMYSSQASEKVRSAFEYQRLRLNEAFLHQLCQHTPTYLASRNHKWVGIARNSSKNTKSVKFHPARRPEGSESSGTATAKQIYGEQIKNSWFVVPNSLGIKIWIELCVDLKLLEHLREINKFNA